MFYSSTSILPPLLPLPLLSSSLPPSSSLLSYSSSSLPPIPPLPRLTPTGKNMTIRVFISSDSAFSVTTHMYKEVEDSRTGEVREGGEGEGRVVRGGRRESGEGGEGRGEEGEVRVVRRGGEGRDEMGKGKIDISMYVYLFLPPSLPPSLSPSLPPSLSPPSLPIACLPDIRHRRGWSAPWVKGQHPLPVQGPPAAEEVRRSEPRHLVHL